MLMKDYFHTYHLVDKSPWPLFGSLSVLFMMISYLFMFKKSELSWIGLMSFLLLLFIVFQWWRDVIRESTFQGNHSLQVMNLMKLGMILFILSELMFFVSFFWTFFHVSLVSSIEVGFWPPVGVSVFNPMEIPLLNTMILLSSGFSITWSHHMILSEKYEEGKNGMILTVLLGFYFFLLQMYEYIDSSFSMMDSIYGSVFFIGTGFHGLHVILGTIFIFVMFFRQNFFHFSKFHHFGFEASCWYWHFVDLVWLFLYIFFYWWGK